MIWCLGQDRSNEIGRQYPQLFDPQTCSSLSLFFVMWMVGFGLVPGSSVCFGWHTITVSEDWRGNHWATLAFVISPCELRGSIFDGGFSIDDDGGRMLF